MRMLEQILDEGLKKSHNKMAELEKFMIIYDKKAENVIMDLKKKTFALENEYDDEDQSQYSEEEERKSNVSINGTE